MRLAVSPQLSNEAPKNSVTITNSPYTLFLALGAALARASRPLVYGGGSIGLMGAVAEAVLKNGGYVTGVTPYAMTISGGECLKVNESGEGAPPLARLFVDSHPNRENVVVDDMHTRKQLMALNATGGFVCLPGGYGTLEEVGERLALVWQNLKFSGNIGAGSGDLGTARDSSQAYVVCPGV